MTRLHQVSICISFGLLTTFAVAFAFANVRPRLDMSTASRAIKLRMDGDGFVTEHVWVVYGERPGVFGAHAIRSRGVHIPEGIFHEDFDAQKPLIGSDYVAPEWTFGVTSATRPYVLMQEDHLERTRVGFGWPLPALWSSFENLTIPVGELSWESHRPVFPTVPIRRGFIICTLLYAAVWFGIFFGFGSARRAVRRRRGRCPYCAYQLRGEFDQGCSECGWKRLEGDA